MVRSNVKSKLKGLTSRGSSGINFGSLGMPRAALGVLFDALQTNMNDIARVPGTTPHVYVSRCVYRSHLQLSEIFSDQYFLPSRYQL